MLWEPAPTTKEDYYRRWLRLDFGNRIRMWGNYGELCQSDYSGLLTMRYQDPGSPFCRYLVPRGDVSRIIVELTHQGADAEKFTFNEAAPDDDLLFQGELCHGDFPYFTYALFWSDLKVPMREGMRHAQHAVGLQALGRLKAYTNDNSYAMLMDLLDVYPEAVIEFGVYQKQLGVMPGHNCIIWEIRSY